MEMKTDIFYVFNFVLLYAMIQMVQ